MSLEERALLEAFVVDNPDLERLESLLAEFNIFEALWGKKVRGELRHSDFLAFLLNPTENHGLGDIFLRKLLNTVKINIDSWDNLFAQFVEIKKWPEEELPEYFFEFEFVDDPDDQLWLTLYIGSGHKVLLQAIHQFAKEHPHIFRGVGRRVSSKWTPLYERQFLGPKNYEDVDFESMKEKVGAEWNSFLTHDLPAIHQALSEIKWPTPHASN